MDYGYQTLAMFSETGELTRFPNPTSSGLILVSTGATTTPEWRDLALTDIKSGFPNAGVMISTGANQQPTSKAGSADKQFLKYSVSNNVGSYGFSAIGISDITGLQTALDGLVHSHPYLPLAGGVMNDGSAVSLDITEQHGNYYGLAYGSVTVSTSISEGSTEGRLLIETPIPANASSGIDFLPPSDGGEQYYQIHITGLDTTNKGKTIDIKIGLGLKASPQGNLNASNSGWSSYGTIMPSSITHGVKGNRHAFVIVLPKGSYKLNIDGLFDFGVSRGANFLTEFQSKCIALRGDGGWCLIPDSTSGVTLDNSAMTQYALPMYSHAHEALSAGAGLKYATNGQTYTGEDARTISVDVDDDFNWTGVHSFTNTIKINKAGVLIGKGSSSAIDAKAGSADKQFLKYTVNNGIGSYGFAAITKNDIPNIEALKANAGAAGKLLVSTATGAEWLPAGANGNFLQQTANGLTFSPIRAHTVLQLTSSTTVQFTHTAGTDQTVFLNVAPSSTSTTTFNVKVPSPDSTYAGDRIKFVVLNEHDDTYTPIINFVPNDSNDAWQGDHAYDSDPLPTAQRRISCGEMMILYGVSYTANSTTHTFWRAQKLSETSF